MVNSYGHLSIKHYPSTCNEWRTKNKGVYDRLFVLLEH